MSNTRKTLLGLLLTFISIASAQELEFHKFYIYDINSVSAYLNKMIKKKTIIRSNTRNIPTSAFILGDRTCGYFFSQYKGPFSNKPAHKRSSFIACSEDKGHTKLLSVNYLAEYIEKDPEDLNLSAYAKLRNYLQQKEGIDLYNLDGPIDYISFDDKVLLFYSYRNVRNSDSKKDQFIFVDRQILVKEYDKDLHFIRKYKIDLITEKEVNISALPAFTVLTTALKMPGQVHINHIFTHKVDNNKFAIIYSVSKFVSEAETSHSLHIKLFNKGGEPIGDELVIDLPFSLGIRTKFIVSDDGRFLYFVAPVALIGEETVKGLAGKLLGKKEQTKQGLFVFMFKIELSTGDYDFGAVNLGNPQKDISSLVFKRSPMAENTFLIALAWTLNTQRGVDILKVKIDEQHNEMTLVDKITTKLPQKQTTQKLLTNKQKEQHTFPAISDISELENHYMIFVSDVNIILTMQDNASWYTLYLRNPSLITINKEDKSNKVFVLESGGVLAISALKLEELIVYNNISRNALETMGFLNIETNKILGLFITPKLISGYGSKPRSKRAQEKDIYSGKQVLHYISITESESGQIEVTKAKPLGPSEGNAMSFGFRSVVQKDTTIYAVFSIDNIVPAIAKFKVRR